MVINANLLPSTPSALLRRGCSISIHCDSRHNSDLFHHSKVRDPENLVKKLGCPGNC